MRRRFGIIFIMCLLIACGGCVGYAGYGYYDYPYYDSYYDYDDYYYPHNYYFFRGGGEKHERHEIAEEAET